MKYLYIPSLFIIAFSSCADFGKTDEGHITVFNALKQNMRDSKEEIRALLDAKKSATTYSSKLQSEKNLFEKNSYYYYKTEASINNAYKTGLISQLENDRLIKKLEKISWVLLDEYI